MLSLVTIVAGVDLGGTKIQTVVVRARRVVGQARLLTPRADGRAVVTVIRESIEKALADAGDEREELGAIGVGTPGEVDSESGDVSRAANVPGLEVRFPLGRALSDALGGVPVRVDNDVRAATLGEFRRGAGRPYRDLLGVFVGTGVGGGLVLGGKLRHGRGAAGEIGHLVVKPGGRRCTCGRRGCLEAYAGRGSMELVARRRHERGTATALFRIMHERGRDRITSGVIAQALERGDALAEKLVDQAVWALGIGLASAQNLLDLEAIIVGGGLGDRLGDPFVARVEEAMRPHLFAADSPPALLRAALGDLSGAVGAAVVAGG